MTLFELGISPQKEKQFTAKGIESREDLMDYLPTKYRDFRNLTGILPEGEVSVFTMKAERLTSGDTKIPYVKIAGRTQDGKYVSVVFFHQSYLAKKYSGFMGYTFIVAGKVKYNEQYNNYSVSSPDLFEVLSSEARRIYPAYKKIPGMSEEYLTSKIKLALGFPVEDPIPREIIERFGLLSKKEALINLHLPETMEQVAEGQKRFVYEDLLRFALYNEWADRNSSPVSAVTILRTKKMEEVKASLPYTLTEDQQTTIDSMVENAKQHKRIRGLVSGDVGCGKTIISNLLMVLMAENGYQAVLMAPTQVLANQHYKDLKAVTEPFGFKTVYLGSELKAKEKKAIIAQIAAGEVDFVVGTHSVISEGVHYKKLGLTVTDEEHKFGVAQRNALVKKAAEGVHSITMSATPIPRTLATVMYGSSIQVYTIKTMPIGRKPVITGISTGRDKIYRYVIREAEKGHQTYVVCPMIDQSDKLEGVKSVEAVSAEYKKGLALENRAKLYPPLSIYPQKELVIETLTGRNSKAATEDVIDRFSRGEIDVLVSTTVVEVGVNVPTATLMVVSSAERFGLAALHQLRGRVGRSDLQAYCVLESENPGEKGMQRLEVLVSTNDGFEIAKKDLEIRGAGDFLGTKQSGDNKYMSLVLSNQEVYTEMQAVAKEIIDNSISCGLLSEVQSLPEV